MHNDYVSEFNVLPDSSPFRESKRWSRWQMIIISHTESIL